MKALKLIGILLVIIVMILFFALPTSFHIDKEIIINQNSEAVFEQVNNLKNWEKWSPWQKIDSNIVNEYEGPESGVGAINIFKSNHDDVGNGKMEIVNSNPLSYINIALYLEGMSDENTPTMENSFSFTDMTDNHVKVNWVVADTIGQFSPWRLFIPFMSVMLSDMMEQGLNDLKKVCEDMNVPIVDVVLSEGNTKLFRLITLRDTSSVDNEEIKNNMNSKIIKIVEYMKENSIVGENLPFTIQHLYDKESNKSIYEYGFPLKENIVASSISEEFNVIEIGGSYSVSATHTGPLRTIDQAHIGVKKYIELKGYKLAGSPYQYITTNPDEVGEWGMVSEVYYPVIKN